MYGVLERAEQKKPLQRTHVPSRSVSRPLSCSSLLPALGSGPPQSLRPPHSLAHPPLAAHFQPVGGAPSPFAAVAAVAAASVVAPADAVRVLHVVVVAHPAPAVRLPLHRAYIYIYVLHRSSLEP
eukprot:497554-Prorocentrum_minimum.AAC.1